MSQLVGIVIEFVVALVGDWLVTRWPWLVDVMGAAFLAFGVLAAMLWPRESGDRMAALIVCGGTGLVMAALLLYRAWRRRRAAAIPAEGET